jgi:hypothetical protein
MMFLFSVKIVRCSSVLIEKGLLCALVRGERVFEDRIWKQMRILLSSV